MELLKPIKRAALLVIPIGIVGCLMISGFAGPSGPVFPHSMHGEEAGLECASCHRTAATGEQAGMPTEKQCMLCHEELDQGKPPEKRASAFFVDHVLQARHGSDVGDEVIFSHAAHVTGKSMACAACHPGVEGSDELPDDLALTMVDCMGCHSQAGLRNDCAVCHQEIRAELPPPNHTGAWTREHGPTCRAAGITGSGGSDGDSTESTCMYCHGRNECESCHRTEAPANHNNWWRRRGHGFQVAIDRDSCSNCHQADSCDRCHQESAPVSHTAAWGSSRNRHCVGCHLPLGSDEGCATCHRSTPSHQLAAPLPPDHTAGMNCRQCHGLSAPLPHPDKGDSCTACHR